MTPSTEPAVPAPKATFAYALRRLRNGLSETRSRDMGIVVGLLIAVVSHPFTWFLLLEKD